MRTFLQPVLTTITIFLLLFAWARFGPGIPMNMILTPKTDSFRVTGEGKAVAIPDTAKINVGITIDRANLKDAQQSANSTINKFNEDLIKLGIKKEQIKTTNYTISPDYDYSSNPPQSKGFTISINQEITIEQLDLVNQVIDTAVVGGGNLVGGLAFDVNEEKKKELEREARKKAIAQAREKAGQMASSAGIGLGRVINIQEEMIGRPFPVALEAMSPDKSTQVMPGTSEITNRVTLTFETR